MLEIIIRKIQSPMVLVRDTHVVYKSGRHGDTYLNKDMLFTEPEILWHMCELMADLCNELTVDVVVGPVVGGALLAQGVALHLTGPQHRPRCAYAEKINDDFAFKRGYDHVVRDARVLIVDDVATTGGSIRGMMKAISAAGGTIVGAVALINRGTVTREDLNLPFFETLHEIPLQSWNKDECLLCQKKIPVNEKLGHGAEFMKHHLTHTK